MEDTSQPVGTKSRISVWDKTWLQVVLLVFVYPVGVILMWVRAPWKTGVKLVLTVVLGLVFLAAIGSNSQREAQGPKEDGSTQIAERNQDPPEPSHEAEAVIPADQLRFVSAVEAFYDAYEDAPNELKKSALRTNRRGEIANALSGDRTVSSWAGTLRDMGTNSEGKAYVSIQLEGSKIRVQTWNNALSDITDGTLIDQSSPIFDALSGLSEGDRVTFDGRFMADDRDFIEEQSVTERGSMTSPEFTFRFTRIVRR
ncbi:MAG TPA: hypothetical protein VNN55_02590 [bacterium]|nr:hypothetical protein [bacterium]